MAVVYNLTRSRTNQFLRKANFSSQAKSFPNQMVDLTCIPFVQTNNIPFIRRYFSIVSTRGLWKTRRVTDSTLNVSEVIYLLQCFWIHFWFGAICLVQRGFCSWRVSRNLEANPCSFTSHASVEIISICVQNPSFRITLRTRSSSLSFVNRFHRFHIAMLSTKSAPSGYFFPILIYFLRLNSRLTLFTPQALNNRTPFEPFHITPCGGARLVTQFLPGQNQILLPLPGTFFFARLFLPSQSPLLQQETGCTQRKKKCDDAPQGIPPEKGKCWFPLPFRVLFLSTFPAKPSHPFPQSVGLNKVRGIFRPNPWKDPRDPKDSAQFRKLFPKCIIVKLNSFEFVLAWTLGERVYNNAELLFLNTQVDKKINLAWKCHTNVPWKLFQKIREAKKSFGALQKNGKNRNVIDRCRKYYNISTSMLVTYKVLQLNTVSRQNMQVKIFTRSFVVILSVIFSNRTQQNPTRGPRTKVSGVTWPTRWNSSSSDAASFFPLVNYDELISR